jgi:hypothetical protein
LTLIGGCDRHRQMRARAAFPIVSWKGPLVRETLIASLLFVPSGAIAHAGHATGTGHDLWAIAAVFVAAALFALIRRA